MLWGAIVGDIVGAVYEFDNIKIKTLHYSRNTGL